MVQMEESVAVALVKLRVAHTAVAVAEALSNPKVVETVGQEVQEQFVSFGALENLSLTNNAV